MKTYKCSNCGAEVIFNEGNFSTCIYCGNVITIVQKEYTDLNIKKIIMFNVDEEGALQELDRMYSHKRDEVKSIDKYYIPVRFMDFNFDYYCDYDYIVKEETENNREIIERRADLVHGSIDKEAVIQSTKFNKIIGFHDLRDTQRLDFDPVYLKDISCDFNMRNNIDFYQIADDLVHSFGTTHYYGYKIKQKYNSTYNVNNIKVEDFTTLQPVYFIKLKYGATYAISGCINSKKMSKEEEDGLRWIYFLFFALGAAGFVTSFYIFSRELLILSMIVPAVCMSIAALIFSRKGNFNYYQNYSYTIHTEHFREKKFDYEL